MENDLLKMEKENKNRIVRKKNNITYSIYKNGGIKSIFI